MITHPYYDLFNKDTCKKDWSIVVENVGTLTNSDLDADSITLQENLCSDSEITFGKCESSILSFAVHDVVPALINKKLDVSVVLDNRIGTPFTVGTYIVVKDEPTLDHSIRNITAYDILGIILNTNYASWYNNLSFPTTLRAFRDSFFTHVGVIQESVSLIFDSMVVEKTIDAEQISGKDILQAICQINGRFGHITREGKFKYIKLQSSGGRGLYPSNTLYPDDDLYPEDPPSVIIGVDEYMHCEYEDYLTDKITKLQIRQEDGDIGAIAGTGTNAYIVEGNFLVFGKSALELGNIANDLFNEIKEVQYFPIDLDKIGNLCNEVGDGITIITPEKIINTYILSRTFKGVQVLNDNIISKGQKQRSEKVNSVNTDIIQLKGKTNTLKRDVEETQATITNVQQNLQSQITQTAEAITTEVTRAATEEGNLQSQITQNATSITAKVDAEHTGSFSWELLSTGFKLKSGSSVVFECDSSGISIEGKITAKSGYIGNGSSGFTIGDTSIRNGKLSLSDDYSEGIYVGTDGINLGRNGFKVTKAGVVTLGNSSYSNSLTVHGNISIATTGEIRQGTSAIISFESTKTTFPSYHEYEFTGSQGVLISGNRLCLGTATKFCVGSSLRSNTTVAETITGAFRINGISIGVILGKSGGGVGFFGTAPQYKITRANATYTSSTTAKTVGDDLNALKTALRDYGLIG